MEQLYLINEMYSAEVMIKKYEDFKLFIMTL